jgi:hypothetical protein
MHPEIVRALMTERSEEIRRRTVALSGEGGFLTARAREDRQIAVAGRWRARVRRRPRKLSRYPRPRPVWARKTA